MQNFSYDSNYDFKPLTKEYNNEIYIFSYKDFIYKNKDKILCPTSKDLINIIKHVKYNIKKCDTIEGLFKHYISLSSIKLDELKASYIEYLKDNNV